MKENNFTSLSIAIRIYPELREHQLQRAKASKRWRRPDAMFVFDTETRTDATQQLIFGSYRFVRKGRCLEEGLFYGDDISEPERLTLKQYIAEHNAETDREGQPKLLLLSRSEFVEKLFRAAYKGRCLLVGFNLPFDISRVACDVATARGRFAGGFSFGLASFVDDEGRERRNQYRPRIAIKHIDNKRALKGFTGRNNPDSVDLIRENSVSGIPVGGYIFRGHFLDLRTLAFAETDQAYSLETACYAFGVKNGKTKVSVHGILTEEYIDYNRQDVRASYELTEKLLEEYDRHPITLQATKAYSPASIGKAYLRAMGIKPVLHRQLDFPRGLLGYAQSAFFGGRTSAHIRKWGVPVVYTDFLSMYPTVNALIGLWRFVTAETIRYVEGCASEMTAFLHNLRVEDVFRPETWTQLTGFVKIIPDGDILPTRAKYSDDSNDWQVGLNYLHAGSSNAADRGLWFSLPDAVASTILTGRVPKIVDAFRIEAEGISRGLKKTRLRGEVEIDPAKQDFFKVAIEERKRLSSRSDLSEQEKGRLNKALKVLSNAASYGIYAEMNAQESDDKVAVTCYGIDREPYQCVVAHPEAPGEYCFPPFASLITGSARLMLALLEHSVTALGGTYAMEDTDSMAIVATEDGGILPCPGGPLRNTDGQEAICALSWKQAALIVEKFAALNPYRRDIIPGSVLKLEDVNFDPRSGAQRQLHCFAISAKRYALFVKDQTGAPQVLKKNFNSNTNGWKEHGLGHLLNPLDLDCEERNWIRDVWSDLIRRSLGLSTSDLSFANLPAVGRVTVCSPWIRKAFSDFNAGRSYKDQIKPFNFLLTAQLAPFGHPTGVDPNRFHLIAPYETDPQKWLRCWWIDQYTGKRYRITTDGHTGTRTITRVKTYAEVLRDYEYHPESKCADANGESCDKQTIGLLQRRHIAIECLVFIGKESNRLDEVEAGMIADQRSVYTEYPDPRHDQWPTKILPILRNMLIRSISEPTGMSRRAIIDLRAGRSRPHPRNEKALTEFVKAQAKKFET